MASGVYRDFQIRCLRLRAAIGLPLQQMMFVKFLRQQKKGAILYALRAYPHQYMYTT